MRESDFEEQRNAWTGTGHPFAFDAGAKAATDRIATWLEHVADVSGDNCTDAERIERGISPLWVVDHTDAIDLAGAIRRGEHTKDMSNDY